VTDPSGEPPSWRTEEPTSVAPPPVIPNYGPPPMPPFGRRVELPPVESPPAAPLEPAALDAPAPPAGEYDVPPQPFHGEYDPHLGYYQPPPEDPRRLGTLVAAVISGLVVAAAGLGIGLLWAHVAPRVGVIKVPQGFVYADAEPEQAIGADAWFAFLGLGAGLVFTVLSWIVLRRFRGVALMIGLVLGSLVGAWLAWWLGIRIALSDFEAIRDTVAVNTRVNAPLVLRMTDLDRHALWPPKPTGVVAAQALAAAITYTVLAGFSVRPSLRPPPKDQQDPTDR
jgi:hypothetical protein